MFQVIGLELLLNRLKSYGKRKLLDLKYKKVVLQMGLQQRILVDGAAQKQQQIWESDNTVRHNSHQRQKSVGLAQRCINLWNNLSFSLCAVLSVYHMVTTSDERKKSEIEVSTD